MHSLCMFMFDNTPHIWFTVLHTFTLYIYVFIIHVHTLNVYPTVPKRCEFRNVNSRIFASSTHANVLQMYSTFPKRGRPSDMFGSAINCSVIHVPYMYHHAFADLLDRSEARSFYGCVREREEQQLQRCLSMWSVFRDNREPSAFLTDDGVVDEICM